MTSVDAQPLLNVPNRADFKLTDPFDNEIPVTQKEQPSAASRPKTRSTQVPHVRSEIKQPRGSQDKELAKDCPPPTRRLTSPGSMS